MYDYIIFDLDGTLSDPVVGITKSINHALRYHGYGERSTSDLSNILARPLIKDLLPLQTQQTGIKLIVSSRYFGKDTQESAIQKIDFMTAYVPRLKHSINPEQILLSALQSRATLPRRYCNYLISENISTLSVEEMLVFLNGNNLKNCFKRI